jgi:acyl-CoA thioester hydrolase
MNDYPVLLEFPVAWGDLDAFGHVNNTQYFRWFESARMAYFTRMGISAQRPEEAGPILATTTCDFLAPVEYPASIVVGALVTRVGNTSFTMEHEVTNDGAVVARGSTVVVWFDYQRGEKARIPDAMRDAMETIG